MISLTDSQLDLVITTAQVLSPEKRDVFLQRTSAQLERRGRFTDDDVADVAAMALKGLTHEPVA